MSLTRTVWTTLIHSHANDRRLSPLVKIQRAQLVTFKRAPTKQEIIELALQLKAADRFEVVEKIMQSLDKPDAEIDRVWSEEALHRARACDEGRMKTISFEEVFGKQ